ncbi:MAG: glycosyl transferase [Clostridia bacterium]|nr:glycosyl transferase [Clostridia bacterium]
MIPKVIHYIWLGGNPLPKIAEKCIESWKKFCPDYEMKRWDETNIDVNKYEFTKDAYQAKKYAFVSDVFRTEILYNEGGVYFDIDVELLKSIENIITGVDCVMGFETSNLLNPGLFIASKKGNEDLKNILEVYKTLKFDINNLLNITVCEVFTKYYAKQGLINIDKTQTIGKTMFYSSEYFSPIDVITSKKKITKNTYSIHWYNASWYTPKQKFKSKIKKFLNIITFGLAGKLYNKIK